MSLKYKASDPMAEISAEIPHEIISEILLRLPAKSIGRSRSVSKPWRALLTSYHFIKSHLAHHSHSLPHQQQLLLPTESRRSCLSLSSLILHLDSNHLRKHEFFDEDPTELVGSCNGLVLVETKSKNLCLINCLTQECVKLPDLLPGFQSPYSFSRNYGFGYDSLSDDYKIVSISATNHDEANTIVDIYSLKMRCWRRRFGTYPYYHHTLNGYSGVFVNGALHWARLSFSPPLITAFDLSSEDFYEIPAPVSIDKCRFSSAKLMVIDGCLGLAVELSDGVFAEIWLMKSYSMVESWTKLVVDMEFIDTWWPYCFHQDKLLFSEGHHRSLKWYHLKDGRVEVCLAENDDTLYKFMDGLTYSESLVSPHFNYHHHN